MRWFFFPIFKESHMPEGVIFGFIVVALLYLSFNFLRGFVAGLRGQK